MRRDGEREHADRNRDSNRNRIFYNVAGETVFDAFSVVLQGENKTREADTGEIKQSHFDWTVRIAEW